MQFVCNLHYPRGCVLTRTATLTNTGSNILVIASITIVPLKYPHYSFSETNTCPKNLNPSESCSIAVTYHPQPYVTATGRVYVTDNASGSPQTIFLSGFMF